MFQCLQNLLLEDIQYTARTQMSSLWLIVILGVGKHQTFSDKIQIGL